MTICFGQSFLGPALCVDPAPSVVADPFVHDDVEALLAWRSPPRFSRCRCTRPLLAGLGRHRWASAASEVIRSGLSPALVRSWPQVAQLLAPFGWTGDDQGLDLIDGLTTGFDGAGPGHKERPDGLARAIAPLRHPCRRGYCEALEHIWHALDEAVGYSSSGSIRSTVYPSAPERGFVLDALLTGRPV